MDSSTRGIFSKWEEMIENCEETLIQNVASISKYGTDSQKNEQVEELKKVMMAVCKANKTFKHKKEALVYCRDINNPENDTDYKCIFKKKLAEIISKHKNYDVESDPLFENFSEKLEEELTARDCQVDEVDTNFIDPITKLTIKHPVKSNVCNHIYDKDSINSMFTQARTNTISCPYMGCIHKLKKTSVVEDQRLTQQFEQFLQYQ